ncbi:hypothetical protein [Serinicoccus kebangsaanensis]|uniref:hypothetical protein n=1 Tax=Serinicoccus kebangsaanensis TaxID=2602069 RepID=UPI00124BDD88|nr:hypothetical protein [Serinicoccus kebangsaanensis]
MSNPRLVLAAGALVAGLLTLLLVVGTWQEQWVLVSLAAGVFGALILVVQVDTWRRTRTLRNYLRDEIRRSGAQPVVAPAPSAPRHRAPAPTQDDVLGVVRVMQAQYTGRLDRMQTTLEHALAQLPRSGPAPEHPRDPGE